MDVPLTNGTNLPVTASFVTIKNAQTTQNLMCLSSGTPTAASANASLTRSVRSINTSTSNHATAKPCELFVITLNALSLNIRKKRFHFYTQTICTKCRTNSSQVFHTSVFQKLKSSKLYFMGLWGLGFRV